MIAPDDFPAPFPAPVPVPVVVVFVVVDGVDVVSEPFADCEELPPVWLALPPPPVVLAAAAVATCTGRKATDSVVKKVDATPDIDWIMVQRAVPSLIAQSFITTAFPSGIPGKPVGML